MKRLLIVVDMQNDFVTGALGNKDAVKIIPNVVEKVKEYIEHKDEIVFTRDTHDSFYLETEEGRNLPIPHCIAGRWGWEIIDELKPYQDSEDTKIVTILKKSFGSQGLMTYMCKNLYSSIEVIGLCTDICVLSNTVIAKAAADDAPVYVDAACCAGVTPESHDTALKALKAIHIHIQNEGKEPWRGAV